MSSARLQILLVSLLLATGFAFAAELPAQPGASIRGQLRDAAGAPASGVFVVVFPTDAAKWSGPGAEALVKRAKVERGLYAVTDLPPGRYQFVIVLETALDGWPSPAVIARLASAKPMPVTLAPGESVGLNARITTSENGVVIDDAMLSRSSTELRRGGLPVPGNAPNRPSYPGSITGRVTDADGRPVEGAIVVSLKRNQAGTLLPYHERGVTDAEGRFRLLNRSAGDYFVAAVPFAPGPDGTTGRRTPPPIVGANGVKHDHTTTFFGGALSVDAARPVAVETSERAGIDIQLRRQPVFDVIGAIAGEADGMALPGPRGLMPGPVIGVNPIGHDPFGGWNSRRVALNADRTFVVPDLPAGEYRFVVTGGSAWIDEDVIVSGKGITTVRLTARAARQITGRVEFRGATPPPAELTNPAQFGIELRPVGATVGSSFSRTPIRADRTFAATAVGSGPFRVGGFARAPWVQIEGLVNGLDSLDVPAAASSTFKEVVVVFADRAATLEVQVVDEKGLPAPQITVVMFTEDTRYWSGKSRRVQVGQTSAAGTWTASNVPPGRYLVATSLSLRTSDPVHPEVVGGLKSRAKSVEIGLGQNQSIRVILD